jgi:hypothetical protein
MAVPIGSTPSLTGEDSTKWWKRVQKEQNEKVSLVPTPKLEKLRQKILATAKKEKK